MILPSSKRRSRGELIRLIVEGRFPLAPLRAELSAYPWDSAEPLVTLRRSHIARVLTRYLAGDLTAADVAAWAEALEVREDVGFAADDAAMIQRIVFVLANPSLNGDLNSSTARALLRDVGLPTS